tara:strand:+ start:894 stop:2165 length:1272 start_codon:yes stop_codon:yes gene_type:complete
MSFRDHAAMSTIVNDCVSVNHGLMQSSASLQHQPVLFDNISECPGHRASMNILTRDHLCKVWELTPGELIDTMGWAMQNPIDPVVIDSTLAECMENKMDNVDITTIPVPWHYEEDRGRYMSASVIIAERNGQRNMSFHRQYVAGPDRLVARLVPRHLRQFTDEARSDSENLNIAIINGADPCVLLAAAMSFNERIDELRVAASLHLKIYGKPLRVVQLSNGVHVPADCEYVMSAQITGEDDEEGPYVDITGTVDDVRLQPVINIQTINHRNSPIFHAILPAGKEHKTLMGLPRAPTIKSAVSKVTECTDVHLSEGGCGWLSSVVSIIPKGPDDSINAIKAALDGHRSMKAVTIVNDDIQIDDPIRVEWAMMTRWQPDTDTMILSNQKGSSLDPSRSEDGLTSKVGFDATIPFGIDPEPFTSIE